jgi:hypothetical protein
MEATEAIRGLVPRRYSFDAVDLESHGRERRHRLLVQAERCAEMLVDVGVDRQDGQALAGQVAAEQRRERGLAAPALADECKLHCRFSPPADELVDRGA